MTKFISYLILLIIASACDAPHENPLDPLNNASHIAKIYGRVETISLPRENIKNATVTWANENISVSSDKNGRFVLNINEVKNGWLYCSNGNFFSDSVYIRWNGANEKRIDFYLNRKPEVTKFSIISNVIFSSDSTKSETIIITAKVEDRDNDIDSVLFYSPSTNFKTKLDYNVPTGQWFQTISTFEMGFSSFEQLLGKECFLEIYDYKNRQITFGNGYISRLITTMPVPSRPREDEIVQIPFIISWETFPGNFEFKYEIQVFRNEIPAQLAFEAKNIMRDSTHVQVETELPTGNYVWTLSVVDEFGNKVRSKPNAFKINN